MTWTPEIVTELKIGWEVDGLSASQLAQRLHERFKISFSRSAVIGKIHRLGLTKSDADKSRSVRTGAVRGRRMRRAMNNVLAPKSQPVSVSIGPQGEPQGKLTNIRLHHSPQPADDETRPDDPPPGERIGLMDLTATTCRFPLGDPQDPDFGFCGRRCLVAKSNCDAHDRRARQDVQSAAQRVRCGNWSRRLPGEETGGALARVTR